MRVSLVSKKDKELFLEINAPLLSKLEVYQITGDSSKLLFNGGFLKPFHERPINAENWLFNLHLEAGTASTMYVMGQSIYPFQIPIVPVAQLRYSHYVNEAKDRIIFVVPMLCKAKNI